MSRHLAVLVALLVALVAPPCAAARAADANDDHLCGLYSVYAAARMLGEPVQFAELLRPEFVGSQEGSSFDELERALGYLHLDGNLYSGVKLADLRNCPYPAILYVRSNWSGTYDHFVTLVRITGDSAFVIDSGHASSRIQLDDLLPRWSGRVLFVSKRGSNVSKIFRDSKLIGCGLVIGIGLVTALIYQLERRHPFLHQRGSASLTVLQVAVLLSVATATALFVNRQMYGGFQRASASVSRIEDWYTQSFDTTVATGALDQLAKDGAIIIDARSVDDYNAGHISNAISLPFWSVWVDDAPTRNALHRGHAGLAAVLQKASETIEMTYPKPPEFVAEGDRVMVIGVAVGKIKATNKPFKDDWVFDIKVRNGKLTNIREYIDTQELAQASKPAN